MKLIIDNANIDEIRSMYEFFPMDGVTCNPTILAKEKRPPYEVLKEIRDFIEEGCDLDGLPVRLVDTAGRRESPEHVEERGVAPSREQLDRVFTQLHKRSDIIEVYRGST